MARYSASIITIGDEILIGQIVDSNSAWLADYLFHAGFEVKEIRSISDQPEHIQQTLDDAIATTDLVLLTGGLGPTNDDRTKFALNAYFNGEMVLNESVLDDIKAFIVKKRGYLKLTENNKAQALVSDKATVLRNPIGTAPIQMFNKSGTLIVSMPGVPFEMKHVFEHKVMAELHKHFVLEAHAYRTFHVVGYPESELANKLEQWENDLPESLELAYLPSPGVIRLRLKNQVNHTHNINLQAKKLYEILGSQIIAEGKEKVEFTLGKILKDNNKTISVAESCTGGLLGHRITSVAGASAYLKGGITAYSNEAKEKQLGVNSATLEKHGAVSEAVAKEMAIGAAKALNTNYAISTTGIAGPDGGTETKPVGTVWIGFYLEGEVHAQSFLFTHDRMVNMERTATVAMYNMIDWLRKS
ncbi:MAG TPA: CinA family nicotinamide mononucleotide deamidase-related protein [Salinivirga sp.]|uniref:CinA family nicotinamide mononucleotide deamidase-related protein n=1 Tax=Salinivirga sp. TaxID=1970192 RepID=UPI002B47C841|nr:CinA family nicotinamide mononucleotide deamidase-related protein [Salinivirga sp.]HKK60104.1 CinA family nicotinamide mononucleotide deamidase-related protein [Salinivirga sp.]